MSGLGPIAHPMRRPERPYDFERLLTPMTRSLRPTKVVVVGCGGGSLQRRRIRDPSQYG
jgi:hypothetical protein